MDTMLNLDELQQKNRWWESSALINEDDKLKEFAGQKYQYRHPLENDFPEGQPGILSLRGPRQIGKTTLLKLLVKKLLDKSIPPYNVFYYSCNLIKDYKELNALVLEYLNFAAHKTEGILYIFLDEVSFVSEWQRAIKDLAEGRFGKRILFLLTGSSTIDLKFSSERLPGRRGQFINPDIEYLPLTFREFIKTIDPGLLENDTEKAFFKKDRYRALFEKYVLCGGFPTAINSLYRNNFIETTVYKLYTSWISGDLHKLGKSDLLADQMFKKLTLSLTTPISFYELTKESGLASHGTCAEYVEFFVELYCLLRLDCYLIPQKRADPKKNHKFYFTDPFILSALNAKATENLDEAYSFSKGFLFNELFYPKLVEAIVASHLKRKENTRLFYGRMDKDKEIDFVRSAKEGLEFFEVKYQRNVKKEDFDFVLDKIAPARLTVVTRDDFSLNERIDLLPLEVFLAMI